jgi:hypothetical protein
MIGIGPPLEGGPPTSPYVRITYTAIRLLLARFILAEPGRVF